MSFCCGIPHVRPRHHVTGSLVHVANEMEPELLGDRMISKGNKEAETCQKGSLLVEGSPGSVQPRPDRRP